MREQIWDFAVIMWAPLLFQVSWIVLCATGFWATCEIWSIDPDSSRGKAAMRIWIMTNFVLMVVLTPIIGHLVVAR
jgi:hypothetical protein